MSQPYGTSVEKYLGRSPVQFVPDIHAVSLIVDYFIVLTLAPCFDRLESSECARNERSHNEDDAVGCSHLQTTLLTIVS